MSRRLPPFPGSRLRQGARRMEPDGALLQLHPCAQHPRVRRLRGRYGSKGTGSRRSRMRSRSLPTLLSARYGAILWTYHATIQNPLARTRSSRLTHISCSVSSGKSLSCLAPFAKIFLFGADPNQMHIQTVSSLLEGRIAIVTD